MVATNVSRYKTAEAINFPDAPATVLLRASDLAAILQEVKSFRKIKIEHDMQLDVVLSSSLQLR